MKIEFNRYNLISEKKKKAELKRQSFQSIFLFISYIPENIVFEIRFIRYPIFPSFFPRAQRISNNRRVEWSANTIVVS